jgi:hypothetical protein
VLVVQQAASGVTSFPEVDGVTPRTLWGYLALQVGGSEGYQIVRADDEALTAPGSVGLKRAPGRPPGPAADRRDRAVLPGRLWREGRPDHLG